MAAFLGISMSRDSDRLARLEAKRFHAVVNEVRDEAILAGQNYLLMLNEKSASYRFSAADSGRGGRAIFEDGLLRKRNLQNGVGLESEVFEDFDDAESDKEPTVLITSLGEITPFEISFIGEEDTIVIFLDETGNLASQTKSSSLF